MLPAVAEQVEAFLNVQPLQFADADRLLGAGHGIGKYEHLMQRVVVEQLDALFEPPAAPVVEAVKPGGEEIAPTITIDDFAKIDLRIAKIVECKARGRLDQAAAADAGRRRRPDCAMCSAASPACTSPSSCMASSPCWWPTWRRAR